MNGGAGLGCVAAAGGFIPQLFFLSACHSGSLISMRDWAQLQQAQGQVQAGAPSKDAAPVLARVLEPETSSGYTGTALELLRAGVQQVIAMRYAVGDDYDAQSHDQS